MFRSGNGKNDAIFNSGGGCPLAILVQWVHTETHLSSVPGKVFTKTEIHIIAVVNHIINAETPFGGQTVKAGTG